MVEALKISEGRDMRIMMYDYEFSKVARMILMLINFKCIMIAMQIYDILITLKIG